MAKAKTPKQTKVGAGKRESLALTIERLMSEYIGRIDLDADYQREKVWSRKDHEKLLDSIIKDIDIPKLYLAKVHNNKQFDFECIDGKQRLLTLIAFLRPEVGDESPLRVDILTKKYTYEELKEDHPTIASTINDFILDFVIYDEASLTDGFVQEIFRRLQLGIRLNSGELLNSLVGTIRDFVFKDIGKDGPFLKHTKLSDKRYSRQFTLSQICINSFYRKREGEFCRARLLDLEEFFGEQSTLSTSDSNLGRIRKVLNVMDKEFGEKARSISSRAIAVSAYLFVEELVESKKAKLVAKFVRFFVLLLDEIEKDMERVSKYQSPKHPKVLDEFQKYVLQASVEPYAIKRRHLFLTKAFEQYRKSGSKQLITGG